MIPMLLPALLIAPTPALPPAAAAPAAVWNDCGHRVIAAIASEELDPEARRAIVALLEQHPAARDATSWADRPDNGDDPDLNLFLNASVFPDDARRPGPFKQYDIGPAHYINFRLMVDERGRAEVLPPLQDLEDDDPHGDVVESLGTNLAIARDRSADPSDRALALSWIFHQVGDMHQPLHNVARFSPATPTGDRGGNDVRFGGRSLHSYWDNALGTDPSPEAVLALADELRAEHPREAFADRLAGEDLMGWSGEGVGLCLRYVYRDLDPTLAEFEDIPVGYGAEARAVARRQCALAGYRLADLLGSIAGPAEAPDQADAPGEP